MLAEWADNPILRHDARSLLRRWWAWAGLIVIVWMPAAMMSRGLNARISLGAMLWWQAKLVQATQLMIRPDILLIFFLVHRAASARGWHSMRTELALTRLSCTEIVAAKGIVPLLVVVPLNIAASWFYYRDLMGNGMYILRVGESGVLSAGSFVAAFAAAEDILYAAMVTTIVLREFLYGRDLLLTSLRAIAKVSVAGFVIYCIAHVWDVVLALMPWPALRWLIYNPAAELLIGNAVWFAMALPFEWWLIRRYLRRMEALMPRWMEHEGQG